MPAVVSPRCVPKPHRSIDFIIYIGYSSSIRLGPGRTIFFTSFNPMEGQVLFAGQFAAICYRAGDNDDTVCVVECRLLVFEYGALEARFLPDGQGKG